MTVELSRIRGGESFVATDAMESEPFYDLPLPAISLASQEIVSDSAGSLENLPPKAFCDILSYLGPTSGTLISLACINKHFCTTMGKIGSNMMSNARLHFRKPLRAKCITESATSLFIRHARICSRVFSDLTNLRFILNRDPAQIGFDDVERALATVLELLTVGPALSISLERQILFTAGKCGGKVFKYTKLMTAHGSLTKDQTMLVTRYHDLSRKIMQAVIYREIELSRQQHCPPLVQKHCGIKTFEIAGCF
jgi:hypothetical protein